MLDEDLAKQSIELGAECEDFPVKVGRLRSQVKIVVDQVKQQARHVVLRPYDSRTG